MRDSMHKRCATQIAPISTRKRPPPLENKCWRREEYDDIDNIALQNLTYGALVVERGIVCASDPPSLPCLAAWVKHAGEVCALHALQARRYVMCKALTQSQALHTQSTPPPLILATTGLILHIAKLHSSCIPENKVCGVTCEWYTIQLHPPLVAIFVDDIYLHHASNRSLRTCLQSKVPGRHYCTLSSPAPCIQLIKIIQNLQRSSQQHTRTQSSAAMFHCYHQNFLGQRFL